MYVLHMGERRDVCIKIGYLQIMRSVLEAWEGKLDCLRNEFPRGHYLVW